MTVNYDTDYKWSKKVADELYLLAFKPYLIICGIIGIIVIFLITFGYVSHNTNALRSGYIGLGVVGVFLIYCLVYRIKQIRLLHNTYDSSPVIRHAVEIDDQLIKICNLDKETSVSFRQDEIKSIIKTKSVIVIKYGTHSVVSLPKREEFEGIRPTAIPTGRHKYNYKSILVVVIVIAIIGIMCGFAFGYAPAKLNRTTYFGEDSHYIEYECVVSQVKIIDGHLCFTGEITTDAAQQSETDPYWFVILSEEVDPTILQLGDTISFLACDRVFPNTTFYPIAEISIDGIVYLQYSQGTKDIMIEAMRRM